MDVENIEGEELHQRGHAAEPSPRGPPNLLSMLELLDLSISPPDPGVVNFHILRILLGGMIRKLEKLEPDPIRCGDLESYQIMNYKNYLKGEPIVPIPGYLVAQSRESIIELPTQLQLQPLPGHKKKHKKKRGGDEYRKSRFSKEGEELELLEKEEHHHSEEPQRPEEVEEHEMDTEMPQELEEEEEMLETEEEEDICSKKHHKKDQDPCKKHKKKKARELYCPPCFADASQQPEIQMPPEPGSEQKSSVDTGSVSAPPRLSGEGGGQIHGRLSTGSGEKQKTEGDQEGNVGSLLIRLVSLVAEIADHSEKLDPTQKQQLLDLMRSMEGGGTQKGIPSEEEETKDEGRGSIRGSKGINTPLRLSAANEMPELIQDDYHHVDETQQQSHIESTPVNELKPPDGKLKADESATEQDIHSLFHSVATVVSECANQKDRLDQIVDAVRVIESGMVTKQFLIDMITDKADKGQINTKVSYDEFGNTIDELHAQLHNLMVEGYQRNENWKKVTSDLAEELAQKLDKVELAPIRAFFKSRLKKLEERVGSLASYLEQPDPSGTRRKWLKDQNCFSCDRKVNITGICNASPIPNIEASTATQNSAARIAYGLHRIRDQQKFGNCN